MKISLLRAALISGMCVLFSCSQKNFIRKENLCTATSSGDTVILVYNRPVTLFAACNDKLQAAVNQINDSRCPVDVTCVWAGKVDVLLQFNGDLNITLEKDKMVDTVYAGHRYSLTLIDVTPAPNNQKRVEASEKKSMIAVVRR